MHKRLLISAFAVVLSCLFLLTACQPTPEGPVVVNKADGKLEQKLSQTPKPEVKYEAPMQVSDTLTQKNVTVSIDAEVIVPNVTAFPVFEVKPVGFTQEQVDAMGAVLLGDSPLFAIPEGTQLYRTKDEVLEQIVKEKARLEEVKRMGDKEYGIAYDGEAREDVYAHCEQSIKEYEGQYQTAPEVWGEDRHPATLALIKDGQTEALKVYAQSGDFPCLYVSDGYHEELGETTGFMLFEARRCSHSTFAVKQGAPENVSISREDAIVQAEKLLQALKITDMSVAYTGVIDSFYQGETAKETEPCWGVTFERVMDGVSVSAVTAAHTPDDFAVPDDNADYIPAFEPEVLFVAVGDEGILGLQWSNMAKVTAKRSDNVALMPFEEVLARAKDNFFYKIYAQENTKVGISISRIKLSLMRIGKQDDKGTFLVVPVWDFIGNMDQDLPKDFEGLDSDLSFLTLNAIDGSVIDREKGY